MARGDLVAAIAMTGPGAGSDLAGIKTSARREGKGYVINGSKTFITNRWHANLICVAVKTDPKAAGLRGISLLVVERRGPHWFQCGQADPGHPST
jgi:acyl-CoA dehydrogenase